jgi:hypothetical protein
VPVQPGRQELQAISLDLVAQAGSRTQRDVVAAHLQRGRYGKKWLQAATGGQQGEQDTHRAT